MYIFLDESGVNKQEGKSSIALVYITVDDLDLLQSNVLKIEGSIGVNTFHWSSSSWKVKTIFIEQISKQNFSIKVAFIQNPFSANNAYEYALSHLVIEKNLKAIIIDGKKSRMYERKFKKVLRDKGISIKKLKTAHDESFPALRVADAVAGLARYVHENPDNTPAKDLYKKLASKILITIEE